MIYAIKFIKVRLTLCDTGIGLTRFIDQELEKLLA